MVTAYLNVGQNFEQYATEALAGYMVVATVVVGVIILSVTP